MHPRLTLSGKYAGKYAWDRYEGDGFGTYSDLLVAGAAYDLTDRWDVGAQGRLSTQYSSGARELSALVRTGYRVVKNLYAGAGYNFARMNDGDFSGSGWRSHGPFLELKIKFDEATLLLPAGTRRPPRRPARSRRPSPRRSSNGSTRPSTWSAAWRCPPFSSTVRRSRCRAATRSWTGTCRTVRCGSRGARFYEPVRFRVRSGTAASPSAWKLTVLGAGTT